MKKKINVLVIEDNEYYNQLLTKALKQSIHILQPKGNFQLVLHSFTNSLDCLQKIRSRDLVNNDTIAFVDYYMNHGVNGDHIIKLLREQNSETMVVLLSQSKSIEEKSRLKNGNFFIRKDSSAPALCCLYLEQFVENKV